MRKRIPLFIILLSLFALLTNAAGISSVHSLESGVVSITNAQKRTAWHPVAILFRFDEPVTATLTITRQTEGEVFQLATVELSANQYAVWVSDGPITFKLGDVLSVTSTETTGSVEIIRKGE